MKPKKELFFWVFLLIATVSSFTSVFKDIKSLQSHKRVEIRFFCLLMKGSGTVQMITDPGGPETDGLYRPGSGTL
jgi:hypothetical protein